MGTSLTTSLNLIKPDDLESVNVEHLNQNFDKIDAAIPRVIGGAVPAGVAPIIYAARITTSTGAGGTNRTANGATNGDGIGGLWPGYQGLPKFSGISAVLLTQYNSGSQIFDVGLTVIAYDKDVIRYRAKRYDSSLANNYGSMGLNVVIVGW